MKRLALAVLLLFLPLLSSFTSDYESAKRKFDLIEKEELKPGSRVSLSASELNAYVQHELSSVVPQGVRNPKLELGTGSASGSAMIDFLKVRQAQGKAPGWLMSKLLEGEKEVRVVARIQSASGRATVDVDRVEVSGIPIEGRMLDFLIKNYLIPTFPTAKVGEPFDLGYRIDKLEINPSSVRIVIGN